MFIVPAVFGIDALVLDLRRASIQHALVRGGHRTARVRSVSINWRHDPLGAGLPRSHPARSRRVDHDISDDSCSVNDAAWARTAGRRRRARCPVRR
jgi:hypothetical protein